MNYDSNEYSYPVSQVVSFSEEKKANLVTECFLKNEKNRFRFRKTMRSYKK